MEMRAAVENLASPDLGRRATGAVELYRAGRELTDDLFAQWKQDSQFAVLVAGEPIVGVAVPPDLFERIRREMNIGRTAAVPAEQSTAEFELNAEGMHLDILTPVDGNGAIQKCLDRFGPGIQQVELPVDDVAAATQILATRFNLQPVYPEPRPGSDGTRVNFFLAPIAQGKKVLVELFQSS
jgi:hypothetical protein